MAGAGTNGPNNLPTLSLPQQCEPLPPDAATANLASQFLGQHTQLLAPDELHWRLPDVEARAGTA